MQDRMHTNAKSNFHESQPAKSKYEKYVLSPYSGAQQDCILFSYFTFL